MLTKYEEYLVSLFEDQDTSTSADDDEDLETSATVSGDDSPEDELPKAEDLVKQYGIKSPVMDIYGRGEKFEIHDNQDLYEIVKMVKDFTDKHFYAQNFKYLTDVSYRTLTIKIIQDTKKFGQGDIMDYHVETVLKYLIANVDRLYPDKYTVTSNKKELLNGLQDTTIVIKQN